MIDKRDLEENIAELEGARDHSPQMCQRLANLYTIRRELFGEPEQATGYSFASTPAPVSEPEPLDDYGDSDFLIAIRGKVPADAWHVVDDLMDTLKAVNPRVYDSVMRKIRAL